MEASDLELIESCLANDQEAFAELLSRYKKLIYNVIYNLMGNSSEVNDIFQEVFIRIFKSLHQYNPDYRFTTWAIKITTNMCLDRLRQKKSTLVPIENFSGVYDNRSNPEEKYIIMEQGLRVRKAVNELPDIYRITVVLFHQQGLSYEEMTSILNEPMTIIKNRLYRARLMLKEKLRVGREEE